MDSKKQPVRDRLVSLTSGAPWHLSCTIERVGPDYLCRIHGGDRHIGAVALSEWRSDRAVTERLAVSGHKEAAIAAHAAHLLCRALRRSIICIAGIHVDGITRAQIEEITQATHDLARRAARDIENQRLRHDLHSPSGLYSDITSNRESLLREIDVFLATPLEELLTSVEPLLTAAYARRS